MEGAPSSDHHMATADSSMSSSSASGAAMQESASSSAASDAPAASSDTGSGSAAAPSSAARGEEDADTDRPRDGNGVQWKKDRVAVLFGYIGTNYSGLQKNPGIVTVESELETAIHKARGISLHNYGDLRKVGWNRTARTDKGVHAACQVVSLRMLYPRDCIGDMIGAINAHLPPDIRVFDVVRVTGSFNGKNHCSGRQYEYMLPTFTLAPLPPPPAASSSSAAVAPGDAAELRAGGVGSLDAVDASSSSPAAAAAARSAEPATSSAEPAASSSSAAAAPSAATDEPFPAPSSSSSSAPASEPPSEFRLPEARWQALSALAELYRGTHAFHNFTPRMTFGDSATIRFIMESRVSKPFLVEGMEYVRFTLVGQSFMLNQIRHMVGLLVDVVRGAAPGDMVKTALGASVVRLPLAPAEGLFLSHCQFSHYEKKFCDAAHPSLTYMCPEASKRNLAFVSTQLQPHIAHSIARDRPFELYLQALCEAPCSYHTQVPSQLGEVLQRTQNSKREFQARKRGYQRADAGEGEEEGGEQGAEEGDLSAAASSGGGGGGAMRVSGAMHYGFSAYSKKAREGKEHKKMLKEVGWKGMMAMAGASGGGSSAAAAGGGGAMAGASGGGSSAAAAGGGGAVAALPEGAAAAAAAPAAVEELPSGAGQS